MLVKPAVLLYRETLRSINKVERMARTLPAFLDVHLRIAECHGRWQGQIEPYLVPPSPPTAFSSVRRLARTAYAEGCISTRGQDGESGDRTVKQQGVF